MTGLQHEDPSALHEREFSRRSFIKGGGALVVGFSLAGSGLVSKAAAAGTPSGYLPDVTQVDSWLSIGADGMATLKTSQVEVGNGVTTGLLQLFAEELNLPMTMVRHGLWDTYQLVNSGSTGGSTGIQSSPGPALRAASAAAMQSLLTMASTTLGVPVASLSAANGTISGGGKSVTYAQLVGGKLFSTKISPTSLNPGQAPAKPVSQYSVVTTTVPRVDLPAKVSGTYTYVHNVRIPGMIHGRVVRPRGQGPMGSGANIISVDEGSISHIPSAKVVRQGNFLGVVAPHEYDAIQAAAQIKVVWQDNPILPTTGNLFKQMRSHVASGQAVTSNEASVVSGNIGAGLASAAKTLSASYTFHNGSRVPIGPACAVADVTSGSAIVYCSSQQIQSVVTGVAGLLGLSPSQVRVYYYEGASSFGSAQSTSDTPKAAAMLSKLAGAPVRLQLMRWDENGWDNYQSAQLSDLTGGIDANGKLTAYQFNLMSSPYSTVIDLTSELTGQQALPALSAMTGARCDEPSCGVQYFSPNKSITGLTMPVYQGYFRAGSHRSGGEGQIAAFAAEQFIDELAHLANMDPVAFRVQNASTDRWAGVIDAAAQAAGWKAKVANSVKQTGNVVTGRGVGTGIHGTAGMAAAIVDISVNMKTGKISTSHMYTAIDVGLAVNPDGVANQTSGGSIMGLSRVLHEEVKFNKSRVTSLDWVGYPILRFTESPKVTTVVLQKTDQLPLGAGEPGITPIPAAVANAFFDATGVRLRNAPFTPGGVRAALKAAGVA
jgi:CO/xanthine dehydrogenase Mo-binding subunit